jgi:hypothetical protein
VINASSIASQIAHRRNFACQHTLKIKTVILSLTKKQHKMIFMPILRPDAFFRIEPACTEGVPLELSGPKDSFGAGNPEKNQK